MANPFTDIENALIAAGKFITSLASGIGKLFAAEKALAPAVATSIVTLVGDLESLIALSASAVGTDGLNFPADSAAYTQFLKVKADVVASAAVIEQAIQAL
jgi:hypothetical protein